MQTSNLNTDRRLGCEFEMALPITGKGNGRDTQKCLAGVLCKNGINAYARKYSNSPLKSGFDIVVEHDPSIQGVYKFKGMRCAKLEVKSRILTGPSDWEHILPRTLGICKEFGAQVNYSCGHHLHIEVKEFVNDYRVVHFLYNLFYRYEPLIYGLLNPCRTNNEYALSLRDCPPDMFLNKDEQRTILKVLGWDPYRGINFQPLTYSSTNPRVEFRYHHGTLSIDEARHWMIFCLRLVEHACSHSCHAPRKQPHNNRQELNNLLITCGFKPNNRLYKEVSSEYRETGKYILKKWKKRTKERMFLNMLNREAV